MNIDTLRLSDGTYRKAHAKHIRKMMAAGHVTHIQTERGTIAIRPGTRAVVIKGIPERGWTVDRAVSGITDRQQSKWFKRSEADRLVRCALTFLNGELHSFEAGDDVQVYSNQAERDGYVLAVSGDRVLVEYEMPAGTSALVFFQAIGEELHRLDTVPHAKLAQAWVDRIHDQGYSDLWIGLGQRMAQAMPLPARSAKEAA